MATKTTRQATAPSDLPAGGAVEPVEAPAPHAHRTTVPIAPREALTDVTAAFVTGIRNAITGAAYTRDVAQLTASRDLVAAMGGRLNISPEGRDYHAEALDYLEGRIAFFTAEG